MGIRIKSLAVEKSINAIAITDPAGSFTFVNNSFLRLLGFDEREELLGKSMLQCCHHDNRDDIMHVMEHCTRSAPGSESCLSRKKTGLCYTLFFQQLP